MRLDTIDVHVSAVIRSESAGIDNMAFLHINQLALARKRLGAATQFMVTLSEGANPASVAAAIDEKFAADEARTDTKSMQAFVAGAVGEIKNVVEFARMLGYLAVVIVALVLANTVYISAQSRAQEMGVLETIGLTKPRLAALIAAEGVGLGLVGGAIGTAAVLGFFWIRPITLGVEGYGIDFVPSLTVAWQALLASLLVGVVASIGPAIEAARRPLHLAVKAG
jgi:putative ABC transport system permease protein